MGILLARQSCELPLELAVADEPAFVQRAGSERGDNSAAGFVFVGTIVEPAGFRQLGDIAEGGVDALIGIRVTQEDEVRGLDITQHGEEGYIFV